MILAPLFRRRTDEKDETENAKSHCDDSHALTGFRALYVFDEGMTAGNPLPSIASINGDPGAHRERLEQFVGEQGIALEYSTDIAPAKGVSEGGKIKLLPGQSPAETVATLALDVFKALTEELRIRRCADRGSLARLSRFTLRHCAQLRLCTNCARTGYLEPIGVSF